MSDCRCYRCGAVRHPFDLVAHLITPSQRCTNPSHYRCRNDECGVLPRSGRRAIFGVHRLPAREAAWATESEASRERRFREWVKGAPGDMV